MNDWISKQVLLEAIVEKGQSSRRYKLGEIWELNFSEIREVVDSIPSTVFEGSGVEVKVDKKHGVMQIQGLCSNCGKKVGYTVDTFCPNCGMKLDWSD